jgi:hypothetical protein
MTQVAPAAMAFGMSPEWRMPPSAITETPAGPGDARDVAIAVIWGTPTPAMMRVVQIDPGPMPTFTPSRPAATRSLRRLGRRDVAGDDRLGDAALLELADGVDDVLRMAVGGVDDEEVDVGLDQELGAVEVVHADRGADAEAAARVLGGERMGGRSC